MSQNGKAEHLVTLTIDDKEVKVPQGTNIIEAAKQIGTEIPFYCYHPHLSIPGNCRICQVEVEGAPKLMIGCHTQVQDGMVVRTHETSQKVKDTQASTMELLLINHPLDCTVCDQSGHCKLQDYHYQYNARPSRFLENKQHKVKAQPLGPTVVLDGERCIACTRCIRFCDEITKTSEIGLLNRGDRVEIAVKEGHELNNPLSGSVVDLCPVGALTHREWRFNTRIWYTNQVDSVCPGCSTGCNVKVASRDGEVVQVKARLNAEVNKEWLCDEGRYGFSRFLPKERVLSPIVSGQAVDWDSALKSASELKSGKTLVLLSPDLLLEEFAVVNKFLEKLGDAITALAYRERELSDLEKILVSPDYAANFRGAEFVGLLSGDLEAGYASALSGLERGEFENVLFLGDHSLVGDDSEKQSLLDAISKCKVSVACVADESSQLAQSVKIVLPARTVLEKAGLLVNRESRLQFNNKAIDFPEGTHPHWRILNMLAKAMGSHLVDVESDRELTLWLLGSEERLKGLRIKDIKGIGIDLNEHLGKQQSSAEQGRPSAPPA